ncbi:MAG: 50S ribosomal protein L24 [Deltaproteobacteria bacterium]|nr:50S ribosomal protein L24 [Deltaproteobacteria bacterium]
MKNKLKIRRDDVVIVIAGKYRGRTGKVVRVIPETRRVVVEGIALQKRHVKAQGEQDGRIVEKERPLDVSNVALYDVDNKRRIKVAFQTLEDGTKVRVDRKTGARLDKAEA